MMLGGFVDAWERGLAVLEGRLFRGPKVGAKLINFGFPKWRQNGVGNNQKEQSKNRPSIERGKNMKQRAAEHVFSTLPPSKIVEHQGLQFFACCAFW